MNKIILLGDVHGHFAALKNVTNKFKEEPIIQIGDLGLGFLGHREPTSFPSNFYFFAGNHDNPAKCREYPNYLGRFGFNKEFNFFFVGGAWSIDRDLRIEGRDWWPDEELSFQECGDVIALYSKIKPDYILTHDGPDCITMEILKRVSLGEPKKFPNRTAQLLNALFDIHQPKEWYFGHWHINFEKEINGTKFFCLGEVCSRGVNFE